MNPVVEHGFIITKPNGTPWDEYLYPTKDAAERIATLNGKFEVFRARRVSSLKPTSSTTVGIRKELIIDRGEA